MAWKRSSKLRLISSPKELPVFHTWPSEYAFIGRDREIRLQPGDVVHFDYGGPNTGTIKSIRMNWGGEVLFLENNKGFTGEYIAGHTHFRYPAKECRVDLNTLGNRPLRNFK